MDFKGIFYNTQDYVVNKRKRLGKGQFGVVYLANKAGKPDDKYAVKIIEVEDNFDGNDQMLIMRESSILSTLNHKSVVKYYGISFRSFEDAAVLQPSILTEFVPNGSLKKILDDEQKGQAEIEWNATKKYICLIGIADAMRYLHEHGVLHLDLKPENILIDEDYYPKVCDFGLSRCFPQSLTKSIRLATQSKVGTPLYMAPELLEEKEKYEYSSGVDVYAFSMIAYEICTGKLPFHELGDISSSQLKKRILNGYRPKFTEFITENMGELLQKCWSKTIEDRPSFEEIFEKLSSDFSYFYEENIDKEEIDEFLENNEENNGDQLISSCFEILKGPFKSIENKNELLLSACEMGNTKLVKFLLSKKSIDVNFKKIQMMLIHDVFRHIFLKY